MKKILIIGLSLAFNPLPALSFDVITAIKSYPAYVCYGGRELMSTDEGLVWLAKRGCFVSQAPCTRYQANQYGTYYSIPTLKRAYIRCRIRFPFRLGME